MLSSSDRPLAAAYDLAVLDLDGVVYVGREAVPGAAESLEQAAATGMRMAYVTNNAARPPSAVAEHLVELGIRAAAHDVVTGAQAAARLIAARVPSGSSVFVIGGAGLEDALRERDLIPTSSPAGVIAAVAQGYGPEMPWRQVVEGAILVRSGLPWVVSNTDLTIPTDAGIGPGNGTLVRLVAEFAARSPLVAGKPEAALFEETLDRVGGSRPLVVGDRLDTDIEGANRLGWDSLLVRTGVTGLVELVAAGPRSRPSYLGRDLSALNTPQPVLTRHSDTWESGGWRARVAAGVLDVSGTGPADDWWRVAASAAWSHLDRTGTPVEVGSIRPPE